MKRKKENSIIIREVKLNNKSRKGDYFYVKEIGKRGRYYKKNKDVSKKEYIEIYKKGGLRQKRGGITKDKVKVIRRRNFKKLIEIDKVLANGYAQTTIKRIEKLTPFGMKTAYMNLLRNTDKVGDKKGIVRDPELLDIITRPEDVEKWKHRIMYEVEILGDGIVLGRMTNQYPKSLGIATGEIKELVGIGTEITGYDGQNAVQGKNFEAKGWNFERLAKGRVTNLNLRMVFRKGE